MDDVLSLPARLWRSIVGDTGPPLPPPNSDIDAHDESPSQKHRRICLQWKKYRKEHGILLEHVRAQESSLKRIETELQEADQTLTTAQADLKISNQTLSELTENCNTKALQEISENIVRLSSQLVNLDRMIEKRRRHLDEAHFRHNALIANAGECSASLIRQDSFKSISSDSGAVDSAQQTKSELSDLQRQISVVETEIQQHTNVVEALQRQSDTIRLDRHNLDIEKHRLESERRLALGALSLATGKAKQRQEAVSQCQKRLDELMVAQLNMLMTLDKYRESVTIAENMLRQLRNEALQLQSDSQSPTLSPVVFRRHSSPELDTTTKQISVSVTLLGKQESLNRLGQLSVTSRLLVFESQDDLSGSMHIAVRVSNIEEITVYNGSLLIISFKQNGIQHMIRFRGSPADLSAIDDVLSPKLQDVTEIELGPAALISSCPIAIHGESSILSKDLLESFIHFLKME